MSCQSAGAQATTPTQITVSVDNVQAATGVPIQWAGDAADQTDGVFACTSTATVTVKPATAGYEVSAVMEGQSQASVTVNAAAAGKPIHLAS